MGLALVYLVQFRKLRLLRLRLSEELTVRTRSPQADGIGDADPRHGGPMQLYETQSPSLRENEANYARYGPTAYQIQTNGIFRHGGLYPAITQAWACLDLRTLATTRPTVSHCRCLNSKFQHSSDVPALCSSEAECLVASVKAVKKLDG